MTISDDDRAVAECLSVLKAAYPQYKFLTDHAMMELWHRKLSVLDPEKEDSLLSFGLIPRGSLRLYPTFTSCAVPNLCRIKIGLRHGN